MKSTPIRFHYRVDKSIRGVRDKILESPSPNPKSKGVSFMEPAATPSKKRTELEPVARKGKKKMSEASKPARKKRATTSKLHTTE